MNVTAVIDHKCTKLSLLLVKDATSWFNQASQYTHSSKYARA